MRILVNRVTVPSVPISATLSLDETRIIVGTSHHAYVMKVSTGSLLQDFSFIYDPVTYAISMDLDGTGMLPRSVTLKRYRYRCWKVACILLFGPGSLFAVRRRLSIWDVPDVFVDAVVHLSIGMTPKEAKRIITKLLDMEQE